MIYFFRKLIKNLHKKKSIKRLNILIKKIRDMKKNKWCNI